MAETVRRRRFTIDEYHRMGEAGILGCDERLELIAGHIVVREPIGSHHAGTVHRLNRLWSARLGERAIVRVQNPVVLPHHASEVHPDIMLLAPRADFYTASHPTPVDLRLLIEVADTSTARVLETLRDDPDFQYLERIVAEPPLAIETEEDAAKELAASLEHLTEDAKRAADVARIISGNRPGTGPA